MRKIFTPVCLLLSLWSAAQDGLLDASFNGGGFSLATPPGAVVKNDRQKVAIVAGNKIYQCFSVADTDTDPGDFGLVRYNANGSIDNSFDGDGFVRFDAGADDAPKSLVVLSDGSIVLAGASFDVGSGVSNFALMKISSTGALVGSFGTGGVVLTSIGVQASGESIIAQATDEKLVVAGFAVLSAGGNSVFAAARYNPLTGALDNTFDTDGIATVAFTGLNARANVVRQQPSTGSLFLAGNSESLTASSFAIVKLNTNGSADNTFDFDGRISTAVGTYDIAYGIGFTPAGRLVVGGTTATGTNNDFALVQYNQTTGTLDGGFDGDGIARYNVGTTAAPATASNDQARDILVQVDGKIIIAGFLDYGGTTPDQDFALMRVLATGAIDPNFGPNFNGRNIITSPGNDNAYSVALQSSQILLAGVGGTSLLLARFNNFPPTPLPVNLSGFTAVKQGNAVAVQWQTSTEIDTEKFEVERSADGSRFSKIGEVKAVGNSTSVQKYQLVDAQPLAAINHYRLKIVNTDGSFNYSRVVLIRFEAKMGLLVFPNPVRSTLNVQVKTEPGQVRLQLFDMTGRLLKQKQLVSNGDMLAVPFDMGNLKQGSYLLMVNDQSVTIIKE